MKRLPAVLIVAVALPLAVGARVDDAADASMRRFLAKEGRQHAYKATRRLEAENGKRAGWIEAVTDYSLVTGFRYEITAGGGSSYIRDRILRAVLDREQDLIARGQPGRVALALANYTFQPKGIDSEGLAAIALAPKREDHVLIAGMMFLRPSDDELVRLQGRLVKNPSFWVKSVDMTRLYDRIDGVVVPVALHSNVQLRLFGDATFRMTYSYSEIDGRPVSPPVVAPH